MEFRVLGSLEVVDDGRTVVVASPRERALLALLVIHANRALSWERVLDELWGDEPPASGAKTVAFHVYKLREALERDRRGGGAARVIVTEPAGYVLRVDEDAIDARRFERLAAEGRELLADDARGARDHLRAALALWRGEPFDDLAYEAFVQPEVRRLGDLRLGALEDRIAADLACGAHAAVVGELPGLVAENPLRERMRGQLMTALYRAGRQADALRVYGEGRRVLSEELGIDPSPELQQLEAWILRQDPRLDAPVAGLASTRNPYKGLRPFEERDSPDFFGRETLVARLLDRLALAGRAGGLLVVAGPSGSGKSSVVKAGLVPAVRAGALAGSAEWVIAVMLPGAHPFRELAAAVAAAGRPLSAEGRARLDGHGDAGDLLAGAVPEGAPRLVLVIDQFEELFTLTTDEAERSRFLAALAATLAARGGHLLVLATVRADRLDELLRSMELGELVRTGTELVTPLASDELERAIASPAALVGVALEPGLAGEIVGDVVSRPGGLPLLQYALTDLFERSDGQRMTRAGYGAIGGVAGALGRRAEEIYAALDEEDRATARQVFLHLVAAAPTGEPAARRIPRADLRSIGTAAGRLDEVVDAFVRWRLLSVDRDAVSGEAVVEVAHEALLVRWPRLAAWIEGAREDLWMRGRLAAAAAEWTGAGRDAGYLLAGSRLELFGSWAGSTDLELGGQERDFIDASLAEQRRREASAAAQAAHERSLEHRARTRLRALATVLAVAAVLAVGFAAFAFGQGEAAREQAEIAAARELAAASVGNLRADPSLSLLLAVRAVAETADRGYAVDAALDALHWALQSAGVAYPRQDVPAAVRVGPDGLLRGVPLIPLDELVVLASGVARRELTEGECRTYLHLAACADATPVAGIPGGLAVRGADGTVALERLAAPSLAGTRVEFVSALPADLAPQLTPVVSETGIDLTVHAGTDADLLARVAAGDVPDVAVVARPSTLAALARQGDLVDLTSLVDVSSLRDRVGDYLVRVGSVAADGTWPAATGGLYGVPLALEASSLVWYPAAAFAQAGYRVPTTLAELDDLVARMVDEGETPWCLGLGASGSPTAGVGAGAGAVAGATGADFIEDLLLSEAGPAAYDAWASGARWFTDRAVRTAFTTFGRLVLGSDGKRVLNGASEAIAIPRNLAALPLLTDPPLCWLYRATGSERIALPAWAQGKLAAFAFPSAGTGSDAMLRGRVFEIVVFRDRPEVRRLLDLLLSDRFAAAATASLVPVGLWPVAAGDPAFDPVPVAAAERDLLARALAGGSFRVDASDLFPAAVDARFSEGILRFLARRALGPDDALRFIQAAWPDAGP
jgi:DNA-binding SARP family transcriptional activator/ABC-type glycerol-3-phosphate transport system substrate-binding protein